MSDEAKNIIASVEKGILPPLKTQPKNTSSGIETSKRGLDRTTFGLQTLNEQVDRSKKNNG